MIFADLVRRFGHEIEGTPPASGLGAVVWLGPVAVAALLGLAVRLATRTAPVSEIGGAAAPDPALSRDQRARLEEELEQIE